MLREVHKWYGGRGRGARGKPVPYRVFDAK